MWYFNVFNPSVFPSCMRVPIAPALLPAILKIAPSRVIRESHAGCGRLTGDGQLPSISSSVSHEVFLSFRVPPKGPLGLPEAALMGMEAPLLKYVGISFWFSGCLCAATSVTVSVCSQQKEESQSFAQKLQLKVPSVESLIRGGASRAESLFRSSSKENLVRSPSRDSLTPQGENEAAPSYDPPSDIESEAEEAPGSAESLSKEQLLHRLLQVESSLGKYRGKYSEVRALQPVTPFIHTSAVYA